MKLRLGRAIAAGLLAALAACGSSPKENFFTLSGPQTPLPAGSASSLSVFVGPVSVPESVDRTAMVLRTGPHQVEIDDGNRWAEPLKSAIPRVVAETQRFESSLGEGATLDALWSITATRGGAPRTGRTLAQEPSPSKDHQGVAAAHSRALERLARDIAAALR
jgi:hypothetical protein